MEEKDIKNETGKKKQNKIVTVWWFNNNVVNKA